MRELRSDEVRFLLAPGPCGVLQRPPPRAVCVGQRTRRLSAPHCPQENPIRQKLILELHQLLLDRDTLPSSASPAASSLVANPSLVTALPSSPSPSQATAAATAAAAPPSPTATVRNTTAVFKCSRAEPHAESHEPRGLGRSRPRLDTWARTNAFLPILPEADKWVKGFLGTV